MQRHSGTSASSGNFGRVPLADVSVEGIGINEHVLHRGDLGRVPLADANVE